MIRPFKGYFLSTYCVSDTMLSTMGVTVSCIGEDHAFEEDSLLGENHKSSVHWELSPMTKNSRI